MSGHQMDRNYYIAVLAGRNRSAHQSYSSGDTVSEMKVAVPADTDRGLESPVSAHFGHCAAFIVATVRDGQITSVESIPNVGHESCSGPIDLLARRGVRVLVTGGMGMRPFAYSQQVGMSVVRATGTSVREAIENFLGGQSLPLGADRLCRGRGAHQH